MLLLHNESLFKNSAHVNAATAALVSVDAHVQKYGWRSSVAASNSVEGAIFAGTTGESKRLEAIKINLLNVPDGLNISYRAHVQKYGWQDWVSEGKVAGTEHQSKRIEAIQIAVTGAEAENYVVMYRAHVQKYGWQDWVTAGSTLTVGDPATGNFAGTVHESKRIEAIEVAVLKVGENDLLTLKVRAIAQLNNTYNPADYTIDAKAFNKAMEAAKKKINDADQASKITGSALTTIINEVASAARKDVDLIATGESQKETELTALETMVNDMLAKNSVSGTTTKYSELTGIKEAIENAETTIENAKVTTNTPVKEITEIANKEFRKIFDATKVAVKDLVEKLYTDGQAVTKTTEKVLKTADYEDILEALDKITATDPVDKTQLEKLLVIYNGGSTGAYDKQVLLSTVISELGTSLTGTDFLGKTSVGLGDAIDTNDQGVAEKTRTAEQTKYADLVQDYVNSVIAGLSGKTYAKMESDVESAKVTALSKVQEYMRTTIERTTRTIDEVEAKIDKSVFTNAKELNVLLNSSNPDDIPALLTAYVNFCKVYAAD